MIVYHTLLFVVFFYLLAWTTYLCVFAVAGWFYRETENVINKAFNTYAILIPAYKEDHVILDSVRENLKVDFAPERFKLFVIADQLKPETLEKLKQLRVHIVDVNFKNSTKAKAINKALECPEIVQFTHTIILDADNVMARDFLYKVDHKMNTSVPVMQTHRTAKNTQTAVALLDAINEEIGNHIFRKGHVKVGLSAALIGSGMVFKTRIFKKLMAPIRDTAGEDKMLEFALLNKKIKVNYLDCAVVYDEKVGGKDQFAGQRTRWIAARFYFLKNYAKPAFQKLIELDFDYFNKWLQFLLPQKLLLIAYVFVFWLIGWFVPAIFIPAQILMAILLLTFLGATPKRFYNWKTLNAIFSLPFLIVKMVGVLLKAKKVDPSKFNVTEKGV